jgi:hypothetical protein
MSKTTQMVKTCIIQEAFKLDKTICYVKEGREGSNQAFYLLMIG